MSTPDRPSIIVTVDSVVLTLEDDRLKVLLVRRPEDPFQGVPALPGGYVRAQQDADCLSAIRRILCDKTGLALFHLEQLQTFSGPDRDPRGWSVSVAHLSLVPREELGDLADGVMLAPVDSLARRVDTPLAFDHATILEAGLTRLQGKGAWSTLPAFLLPREFTLSQLQRAYEVALGHPIGTAAFRRKIRDLDLLESTGRFERGVGRRPGELFRVVGSTWFSVRSFDRMI